MIISENGDQLISDDEFSYLIEETLLINQVSPNRGGTGGRTLLTIYGHNFPSDKTLVFVKIANSQCKIESISANQILCRTEPYKKS